MYGQRKTKGLYLDLSKPAELCDTCSLVTTRLSHGYILEMKLQHYSMAGVEGSSELLGRQSWKMNGSVLRHKSYISSSDSHLRKRGIFRMHRKKAMQRVRKENCFLRFFPTLGFLFSTFIRKIANWVMGPPETTAVARTQSKGELRLVGKEVKH